MASRLATINGMEPNPYKAPKEEGYEQPAIPDGDLFSVQRLFALVFGLMVTVLAFGILARILLW